ncbi:hypothetical protein MTR_3g466460 [Medicago truncatula]|uniref:Uncharacterized protein n=1 Tax=Medicago truncatula TaxID=3880 RepID=A0A072V8E6_MEDTR|nr:hypothetical protein MTR_3g466460 [Medicago truncatula]
MKYWLSCKLELQVPDGGIEAEADVAIEVAVAIANSTNAMIPTLPIALLVSANDASTTSPASLLVEKEDEQAKKKRILGLKFSEINRIYGDWIDDRLLVLSNLLWNALWPPRASPVNDESEMKMKKKKKKKKKKNASS